MELETIIKIIAEQLNMSEDLINEDTVFEDLGADSLDVFQIAAVLEEEFDMEIRAEDMDNIKNVGDIVSYIKNLL